MTKQNDLSFNQDHFPEKAKFLATCKTGYGSIMLEQYLGKLEEVDPPSKLSLWRLFRIQN